MLYTFFLIWVVFVAMCLMTFAWSLYREWEIGVLIPLAALIYGSAGWWVLYLLLDKITQHVTIH